MTSEMKPETYKCQICSKEMTSSVDMVTHYMDHATSAMGAVNSLIKDQTTGMKSIEENAKISAADKTKSDKADVLNAQKEVMKATNKQEIR